MCQHMEVWFFNPLCSNGLYLIQIDKIKMELFIVYLYNMRSQVTSSKFCCFMYLKIIFNLKETKSATMNIFEKFYFLFKSFVKAELS